MNEPLKILIQKCQRKNRSAQSEIYKLFSDRLFSICLRYTESYDDAQDVFQDGFIHIFDKISQYKFKGSFEGWISRVMVNFCIERLRKKNYLYVINDDITEDLNGHSEFIFETETDVDCFTYQEILTFVRQLPDRYQQVFNLYVIDGYSHKQISEKLNISIGTSKSNLFRAREKLIEMINKHSSIQTISK